MHACSPHPSTLGQGFNITLTVLPSITWQGQEGHQRGASGAGEGAGVALHHYLVSPASHRILHQLAQLPPPWVEVECCIDPSPSDSGDDVYWLSNTFSA